MKNEIITLQVCVKKGIKENNTRVFISASDYTKTNDLGYPIVVAENKEFFVPTSSELYEHHYEVKSFNFPKNANIEIINTPFVKNACPSKTHIKVK